MKVQWTPEMRAAQGRKIKAAYRRKRRLARHGEHRGRKPGIVAKLRQAPELVALVHDGHLIEGIVEQYLELSAPGRARLLKALR